MRAILAIVLFEVILSCSEKYPEHPNYQLKVEQSGYFARRDLDGNLEEQFGLTFELTSNHDTLAPLYLMTCSWDDLARTDNEMVHLGTGCDANFMWWKAIKTDEYLELITTAGASRYLDNADLTKLKFRAALIAIDTTEMDFGFYLFDPRADKFLDSLKSQKSRFIWSNEIQLKRLEENARLPWASWTLKQK